MSDDFRPEGGAAWRVANVHHVFVTPRGVQCLCGATPGTNRGFTEHILEMYGEELDNA